jgi:SAM-dependent methyltransferase
VRNAEFNDPRLMPVYDASFRWGRDDDFFLSIANETPHQRVLDFGCGTGRLTLGIAAAGHTVTGVDPARASLDAALAKPGADAVSWICGTSESLPDGAFDIAFMTSHVAQFFITDEEWERGLADLRRALVPGGWLVFDSRNPAARGWEAWNGSRRHVPLPDGRSVVTWSETDPPDDDDVVTSKQHYEFSDGTESEGLVVLRFRPESELRSTLDRAGFSIEHIYGGWNREPIGSPDGEFLVLARCRP